jgi:hypothetical protein
LTQTCDPAGDIPNSQGSQTGVTLLRSFGVHPIVKDNANHPPIKAAAIEVVVGYRSRSMPDGAPCFLMNPRFVIVGGDAPVDRPVLKDAFAAGYVYDNKRNYIGTTYPHLRPPKKDGFYEHRADSFLYNVTAFAPADAAALAGVVRNPSAEREARKILARAGRLDAAEADVSKMAQELIDARVKQELAKRETRALRIAQRDPGESFRWTTGRSHAADRASYRGGAVGRGGY